MYALAVPARLGGLAKMSSRGASGVNDEACRHLVRTMSRERRLMHAPQCLNAMSFFRRFLIAVA